LEDWTTLEQLAQFPVMIALTWLLTQFFFGPLIDWAALKWKTHVHTRYVVYLVALGLIVFRLYATGGLAQQGPELVVTVVLAVINAVSVALAAMKAHEALLEPRLTRAP